MNDMIAYLFKNLSSKKFFACLFTILLIAIMGIWCLYKLPESLGIQAFNMCVGSMVAVFATFATGNVIGDHFGKSNIDKGDKKDGTA